MKKLNNVFLFVIISILSLFLVSCNTLEGKNKKDKDLSCMKVHYIDVGQGDSILVQVNNKNLLIDAGPRSAQNELISYLKSLNIKQLDYVIATHPHEDHIGGMGQVIKTFNIGKFYAPKVIHNTKTFEYMMNQLKNKKLKVNVIKKGIGDEFNLGSDVSTKVFTPTKDNYEDLNNYSPIIKISYKDTSFMFTGDAEKEAESEALQEKKDLKSTVLKLGHHGSSTSTTEEFFKAVSPEFAIISLGSDNKYGHPHKETLEILEKTKTKYYRTDEDGTIILKSNGESVTKEK